MKAALLTSLLFFIGCSGIPFFGGSGSKDFSDSEIVPSTNDALEVLQQKPAQFVGDRSLGQSVNSDQITVATFYGHQAHEGAIRALVVSPNGMSAYTGGSDGRVVYSKLDLRLTGARPKSLPVKVERRVLLESDKHIQALSLSPTERYLAVAQFSSVIIFDLQKKHIINRLTRVTGSISALAWDLREEFLLIGKANGEAYVWNLLGGRFAGRDHTEALELYRGGASSVVGVIPHPSGRAFFTAEESGSFALRRLLRTDKELGLRDERIFTDQKNEGAQAISKKTKSKILDWWLVPDGTYLYFALGDRTIQGWKVRGLKKVADHSTDQDAVQNITGVMLRDGAAPRLLLATSSRDHRVQFWCAAKSGGTELGEETSKSLVLPLAKLVAQSPRFQNSLGLTRSGENSRFLWVAEKTGILLAFDAHDLLRSSTIKSRASLCE